MKALDIAFKDLKSAFRSAAALVFMFGIPILVTGMFYLMFGNIAKEGEFNLAKTRLVVANQDRHAPALEVGSKTIPGGLKARTLSQLVVEVLRSDDLSDLLEVELASDAESARQAVDDRRSEVAILIPEGFSHSFSEPYERSQIEFYQDPTFSLGPGIVRSIMNQFMNGLSGTKIAVRLALDLGSDLDAAQIGQVVTEYLEDAPSGDDLSSELLEVISPGNRPETSSPMVRVVAPIMAGIMIFYAFYTGTSTAQSILREEQNRTLPRLFTTPTPQSTILTGKFLSVFLTVLVQVIVLMILGRVIFGFNWGQPASAAVVAFSAVAAAASFGIFVNSLLKDMRHGGVIFGGLLTISGMLGMIGVFVQGSASAARLSSTVSLLVPQGWVVRGYMQSMNAVPFSEVIQTASIILIWAVLFFVIGVWRFKRRYV